METNDIKTELVLNKLKNISRRLNNLADELYTIIGLLEHEQKVKQEKTTLQIINIIVPVLTVILFALLFGWLRKRKYSR